MRDPDYEAFRNALPGAALLGSDNATAERFRFEYREELFGLLTMLYRIGLVWDATSLHPNPPDECDLCGSEASQFQLLVDGTTADGSWANMCPKCFLQRGHSVGFGTGQLYRNLGDGDWRLVAGGDPNVRERDDEA